MTATDVGSLREAEVGGTPLATRHSPAQDQSPAVPPPGALVIFGATGDLTKRKLMPGLYALAVDGLLPESFAVIGAGRHPIGDEQFRAAMRDAVSRFARLRLDEATWDRFAAGIRYAQYSDADGGLAAVREALERLAHSVRQAPVGSTA